MTSHSDPVSTISDNPYIPIMAEIQSIDALTARESLFKVLLPEPLKHRPGQFVMAGLPGIGECAISISSGPQSGKLLEMVIRKAGNVTGVLHQLEPSDVISIRGPFGSGFYLEDFKQKNIVIIAGGLGLVPLRSLITPIMDHKSDYGLVQLIIGSRTPKEALFRHQIQQWKKLPDVHIIELVDDTDFQDWDGDIGLVTEPVQQLTIDEQNTLLVLCGPPVMYKFVLLEFKLHFTIPDNQIFVDLERRMRCGLGKCGHCQINHVYCCKEGPVFRYSQLNDLPEALS
ncbi:MAG: FAD/NAD(P)-binding protein [gamma proteobacterium symbiont of Bathyaustriella thionipta]|nr:FAD/NAD(P)-binding protein [gamma proteobacterium symbiont of Bathyaustriella thionipta]MCU7950896.1 FAD/NAD(P)-binding protein [gamma proteobacterium symbiont of Bathyaustriella thionipta]MCU7951800.1 FAD/NAD(P)-binding protein [gamma proteobacterium symbiont of Bathyaustriella thionipta]MCU7957388.1 FAD/NAD(P)-binding protein [gamma proteobacterium symbiont of Bathyaustriella thionipta]MCU7966283.1 FAD/NAD(P)-binding protein [gamma proteobacterium symbiont of Bathyaustriella thionipta]